jgi:hypothetical protein
LNAPKLAFVVGDQNEARGPGMPGNPQSLLPIMSPSAASAVRIDP